MRYTNYTGLLKIQQTCIESVLELHKYTRTKFTVISVFKGLFDDKISLNDEFVVDRN